MKFELLLVVAFTLITGTFFHSFLFFHSVSEGFSAVASVLFFIIVLNNRELLNNGFFTITAAGLLTIIPIVILHTLTYKGMTFWSMANVNQATQYWVISKYSEVLIIFAAMVFSHRKVSISKILVLGSIGSAVLIFLVSTDRFFDAYVEGSGLTTFKVFSEYAVIAMLLLGLTIMQLNRGFLPPKLHYRMLVVLSCLMLSGFMFTLYQDVHGFLNMTGHLFKVLGYSALLSMAFAARKMTATTSPSA